MRLLDYKSNKYINTISLFYKMKNQDIVFVHGFAGSSKDFKPLIEYFEKKGIKCHRFDYKESWGGPSFEELSSRLDKFVKKIKNKFVLVGFSQGGIISSYWLENYKTKK